MLNTEKEDERFDEMWETFITDVPECETEPPRTWRAKTLGMLAGAIVVGGAIAAVVLL